VKARRKVTKRRPWLAVDSPEGRAALQRLAQGLERDPYRRRNSHRSPTVVAVENLLVYLDGRTKQITP